MQKSNDLGGLLLRVLNRNLKLIFESGHNFKSWGGATCSDAVKFAYSRLKIVKAHVEETYKTLSGSTSKLTFIFSFCRLVSFIVEVHFLVFVNNPVIWEGGTILVFFYLEIWHDTKSKNNPWRFSIDNWICRWHESNPKTQCLIVDFCIDPYRFCNEMLRKREHKTSEYIAVSDPSWTLSCSQQLCITSGHTSSFPKPLALLHMAHKISMNAFKTPINIEIKFYCYFYFKNNDHISLYPGARSTRK